VLPPGENVARVDSIPRILKCKLGIRII
jgi:hypothetical protein